MYEKSSIPYLVPIREFSEGTADGGINWIDGNKKWIQLYPYDTWYHPIYGETTVNKMKAHRFSDNFKRNVYGQEITTDYEHGLDKSKGKKASGKILEMEPRDDGLYGLVQFTEEAVKEINAGEWNYWSTSHWEKWTHPQTKEKISDVIDGGGLTNKPWVKGMLPLNFSEVFIAEHPELVDSQSAEESHDYGFPPDPATNPDDAAETGSRRETPPGGEDGSVPDRSQTVENNKGGDMKTLQEQLREALGLGDEADDTAIITSITTMKDEVEPLREVARQHSDKRRFSEDFPAEYKRMQRLEEDNRANFARQFSETLATRRVMEKDGENEKETTVGLSGLAIEKAKECALKFSEGTIEFGDFREFTDAIFNSGVVDYGTTGSSRTDGDDDIPEADEKDPRRFNTVPEKVFDARKLFSEAVLHYRDELMEKDELDEKVAYSQAVGIAADKHPALYEKYLMPINA
jgi:hypothetical protein